MQDRQKFPFVWLNHLLLEQVLPVAEGAKLGLLLFVLKLFVRRTKVEDEVLEGEDDPLQRERHGPRGLVLSCQSVQTPGQAEANQQHFQQKFFFCDFAIPKFDFT